MHFLVLNAGSSSLKFKVLAMPDETMLMKGIVDGIGKSNCFIEVDAAGSVSKADADVKNHEDAIALVFKHIDQNGNGTRDIRAIGHRVVHGGEKYKGPVLVNEEVIGDIKGLCDMAPLHNPANLAGILACRKLLPDVPNVANFDTAFHQTLPQKAFLYGLPYELYEKFRIRKYGFHGISHKYVSRESMRILKENIKDFKMITCHLGAGASICAVSEGKSVEVSMGFTPLEGLMMGTRTGSFDPQIVIYLLRKGFSVDEIEDMILRKSGLKGISRHSYDVRELREDELSGDEQSELAFKMFTYSIQRYIGSYSAVLGGLDVLIFTGGIGEKAYYLRRRICENFRYLGIEIDVKKNRANEVIISSPDSNVTVMVIPTNEELQIAKESYALLRSEKIIPAPVSA